MRETVLTRPRDPQRTERIQRRHRPGRRGAEPNVLPQGAGCRPRAGHGSSRSCRPPDHQRASRIASVSDPSPDAPASSEATPASPPAPGKGIQREARQQAADEAKRIHGWVEEKHPNGATSAQYDAIAAQVRRPRLVAALRADLEARSGVDLSTLPPEARAALWERMQPELDRRQEWEKALAVSRAKVNRERQPAIESALEQRWQEWRAAWEPLAKTPPRQGMPDGAASTSHAYRISPRLLERSPVKPATAVRAVGRIVESFLDMLTAPRQPGAAQAPPPAPDPPERDDTLQRLEQAQKAGEAARQAEEQQRLAEKQRKDKFIEEYKRKMAQAKGLRLKP